MINDSYIYALPYMQTKTFATKRNKNRNPNKQNTFKNLAYQKEINF